VAPQAERGQGLRAKSGYDTAAEAVALRGRNMKSSREAEAWRQSPPVTGATIVAWIEATRFM